MLPITNIHLAAGQDKTANGAQQWIYHWNVQGVYKLLRRTTGLLKYLF